MVANHFPIRKAQRLVELKFAQMDLRALDSFQQDLMRLEQLKQIEHTTGLTDQDLLEQLYAAGFDSRNIEALNWLPIAMVAWASGSVSAPEEQVAEHCRPLIGNNAAVELFRRWLKTRPSDQLAHLWERFVKHELDRRGRVWGRQTGQIVGQMARAVARASGGWVGLGAVCHAEQDWLDRIDRVYGRTNTADQ